VVVFMGMTGYVLYQNAGQIPELFNLILSSAFTGHAAVGGFAGSTFLLTLSKGVSSACYSGDVGIGYASIIHSQANTPTPQRQASLAIFGIFIDTFLVCTCVILLVLITGVWQQDLKGSMLVQSALSQYFPYMNIFMPIFLFILGFSTILAYLYAGLRSAQFLNPTRGGPFYIVFSLIMFVTFSFVPAEYALIIMNISGGLLMCINLPALFALRKEIKFSVN